MVPPIMRTQQSKSIWVLALSTCLCAQSAFAGIIIAGTRVVYPAQSRDVTVQVTNTGENPALLQTWMDDGDSKQTPDESKAPFLVTPPISRVEPGSGQALRLFFTGTTTLPEDRESLFWLNVLEIPPTPLEHSDKNAPTSADKSDSQNYLQLAFRSRIKVFYRPSKLKGTANEAPASLSWKVNSNGQLLVSNPTPYHVTLTRTEALDDKGRKETIDKIGVLLTPGQEYTFKANKSDGLSSRWKSVSFTYINDYGGIKTLSSNLGSMP
ncbi:fimbria/pilus periplasmic chaperone [Xylella fastidiosa subsp. morus]|uniref:Molecular chaperone n=2 Tax=Xylella fastidiosa TaxID=2371 RepID=A0A060HC84_XYLFS|nr:fimbria/pilus periplasmic chaperone [Xylella fastidiosa]AIC10966.1 molecular chaperone [Xylella fastidiosa subsp. sandyi Ann-1]KQH73923.1 pilus assembly protein PapD [Xylella fastidiosa]MBS9445850.1 fimbria/pilus periplasmic chaperone [Xylella fastidiosa subsp. multiplex]MBS9447789.1 fimbria/pilus periplasmic chaperone [Xylella fastidiosa subsp. multiplex]MBS9449816.1 fimbria/pilus periplasmic chaperone [Xylella fastidiosa subsp. multiplex]